MHILGNYQLPSDLTRKLSVDPVFSLLCDAQPVIFGRAADRASAREAICRRHEEVILRDLRRVNQTYRFHGGDVILFNSFRQWSLRGVVDWLEELPSLKAPTLVIVLHYTPHATPGEGGPVVAEYQRAFERMANSPLRERLVVMADSVELQREFGRISPLPVGLLPIPHCDDIPKAVNRTEGHKVKIAFVGEARTDKGFHLLPDLISALKSRAARSVHFLIQGHSPDPQNVAVRETRDRLRQFENVDLITEPLTDEEYKALIAEADIILLPYLRRHYHSQTSGILAEAISSGTPAIVPSGTWMATQVEKSGAGVLFEAGNLASLIQACEQAIATLSELRERSMNAAAAWRQVHNAENFVASLRDAIRPTELRLHPPHHNVARRTRTQPEHLG